MSGILDNIWNEASEFDANELNGGGNGNGGMSTLSHGNGHLETPVRLPPKSSALAQRRREHDFGPFLCLLRR